MKVLDPTRFLPLVAVSSALLVPAAAHADGAVVHQGSVLRYDSDEQDVDDLTLSLDDQGRLLVVNDPQEVRDDADVCSQISTTTVRCVITAITGVTLVLNDADDKARVPNDLPWRATLQGGPGDDTLTSRNGGDELSGGPGNDRLIDDADSAGGDDELSGAAGDDILQLARGDDDVIGGPGDDTAILSSGPDNVTLDDQPDDGRPGERKNIRSTIEIVDGGGGADRLVGNDAPNTLRGGGADDRLDGAGGRDTLEGGTGSDDLTGGGDVDRVTYPVAAAQRVTLDDVRDDGADGELDNVHADIEDIDAGAGNDTLIGSEVANVLDGGDGNDRLEGRGDVDALLGGAGDDTLLAVDGLRERADCGGGDDTGEADTIDEPLGCEHLTLTTRALADADGDGAAKPGDCDDANPAIRPGAPDPPENGVDEDCADGDAPILDRDHDGFNRPQDCDDADARIHPGAPEIPGDSVDENCDHVAAPFQLIGAGVLHEFEVLKRGHRIVAKRLAVLTVTRLPAGAQVKLTCRPPRDARRSCAFASRTYQIRGATPELKLASRFKRRRLAIGTVIRVTVSAPGLKSKILTYRITARRSTTPTITCATPDAKPIGCTP